MILLDLLDRFAWVRLAIHLRGVSRRRLAVFISTVLVDCYVHFVKWPHIELPDVLDFIAVTLTHYWFNLAVLASGVMFASANEDSIHVMTFGFYTRLSILHLLTFFRIALDLRG